EFVNSPLIFRFFKKKFKFIEMYSNIFKHLLYNCKIMFLKKIKDCSRPYVSGLLSLYHIHIITAALCTLVLTPPSFMIDVMVFSVSVSFIFMFVTNFACIPSLLKTFFFFSYFVPLR
ncbi:unnamed protein product, partial [Lymnaea stagnalis]